MKSKLVHSAPEHSVEPLLLAMLGTMFVLAIVVVVAMYVQFS